MTIFFFFPIHCSSVVLVFENWRVLVFSAFILAKSEIHLFNSYRVFCVFLSASKIFYLWQFKLFNFFLTDFYTYFKGLLCFPEPSFIDIFSTQIFYWKPKENLSSFYGILTCKGNIYKFLHFLSLSKFKKISALKLISICVSSYLQIFLKNKKKCHRTFNSTMMQNCPFKSLL